jgi:hypothetical protein
MKPEQPKFENNKNMEENGQFFLNFDEEIEKEPLNKEEIKKISFTEEKKEPTPFNEEEKKREDEIKEAETRRLYPKAGDYNKEPDIENKEEVIEILNNIIERIKINIDKNFYDAYHTSSTVNVIDPKMEEIEERVSKTRKQYPSHEPAYFLSLLVNAYHCLEKCKDKLNSNQTSEAFDIIKKVNSDNYKYSLLIKSTRGWSDLINKLGLSK